MTDQTQPRRAAFVLFWAAAAALLLYQLGTTAVWQSEDRWLEIAREMLLSGDYLRPSINGHMYFDKPLGSYWLEVIAAWFTGGVNEWAMRLPSALAALIALGATVNLGRRLWSPRAGLLAGWILLTGFGFLQWGRLGEADMENLAASIAAVAWYWRCRDRTGFKDYLPFYLMLALGAQFKGLTAIVVPVLAVLPDLLAEGRWRRHLNIAHIAAAVLAAAVYLIPFMAAMEANPHATVAAAEKSSGLALVIRENVVRYFAPFDHTGPLYTYLVAIPEYTFPWVPVLVAALLTACRRSFRLAPGVRWTLWAFALIFVFYTASGSRRDYYILPILPYCALLCARFLTDPDWPRLRRWALTISAALLALPALLLAAVPLLWQHLQQRAGAELPTVIRTQTFTIGLLTLLALAGVWLWRRRHAEPLVPAVTAAAVVLWGGFFGWAQLTLDHYRTEAPFARDIRALVSARSAATGAPAPQAVEFRDKPTGRLVFYSQLPLPVRRIDDPAALEHFIGTPPYPKLVLAYRKDLDALPPGLRNRKPDISEQHFGWEKSDREKMLGWYLTGNPTAPSTSAENTDDATGTR